VMVPPAVTAALLGSRTTEQPGPGKKVEAHRDLKWASTALLHHLKLRLLGVGPERPAGTGGHRRRPREANRPGAPVRPDLQKTFSPTVRSASSSSTMYR
jgi:hypothetical protein